MLSFPVTATYFYLLYLYLVSLTPFTITILSIYSSIASYSDKIGFLTGQVINCITYLTSTLYQNLFLGFKILFRAIGYLITGTIFFFFPLKRQGLLLFGNSTSDTDSVGRIRNLELTKFFFAQTPDSLIESLLLPQPLWYNPS